MFWCIGPISSSRGYIRISKPLFINTIINYPSKSINIISCFFSY
jgi:hypothetical protein